MNRPSLRTLTISLVALTLPLTLLVSLVVTAYLKNTNPANIDITQDLAYLQQSLIATAITFSLLMTGAIVGIVIMYRRDGNFNQAKLPLVLLVTIFVLAGVALLVNSYINSIEDQYLIDHGRPTLEQFFDALKNKRAD